MSGAADPASTQPVGKGGPQTPQAQSANDSSSVNATPPPPEMPTWPVPPLVSQTPVQAVAAGSGTPSGAGGPHASPMSPALLEDTDDEQDEDPEGAWLGNDEDDADARWDEQNKKIDRRVTDHTKTIPMNLHNWDRHMKWGQIRSLEPRIWKKHQESFAMTPPTAPVSVWVKELHSMSCPPRGSGRRFRYVATSRVYSMSCPALGTHVPLHLGGPFLHIHRGLKRHYDVEGG